jgi:hypothetical protein
MIHDTMAESITRKIDTLINQYKADHHGEPPLYIIISPDEGNALVEEVRRLKKYGKEVVITTYRDITIAKHDMFTPGKVLLSNELPETGS